MKKLISCLLVLSMIVSMFVVVTAKEAIQSGATAGSVSYSNYTGVNGNPSGVSVVNNVQWIEENGLENIGASGRVYCATDYGISTEAEDNAPALQALIDNVSASGGGIIFFPIGTYNFWDWNTPAANCAVEMKSNVSIIGENLEKTVLKQVQNRPYALFGRLPANGASATNPLTGCTFQNFTVDAYATGDRNHVCGKAFFFQYVKDCVFRDLRLMGTTATALGIDFIDGVVIDNVHCIDCGRTYTGTEAGTSGIGIGTGGWENENFIITNCVCEGSGQYGIFIENQGIFYDANVPYAKGCIISNCIVRNGINKGIGIRGGQNVTVIGCESYENASHGIFIDNNCKNVKVISCSAVNNGGSGIFITPKSTEHLLIKGCTFVNNQAEGIKVSVDAGSNANKLCIQDCYTDGNTVGIDLSAPYLADCVILGNATLDGINNGTTFTGNTEFNDIINVDKPDTPTEPDEPNLPSEITIAVPYSSMTNGKKLMPDGSFTDGTLGANLTTEGYIDVSVLNDTFGLFYPATLSGSGDIRIAQYDSNKDSLSESFGLNKATEVTDEYAVWEVTKLEGCRYIRIFLNGGFWGSVGKLRNLDNADADEPELPKNPDTPDITDDFPQLIMGSSETMSGKDVVVTLLIKNNPGIAGLAVSLKYDESVLTLKGTEDGGLFSGFAAARNFAWDESHDVFEDGILETFTFAVAEDAEAGDYSIEVIIRSCVNEDLDDVELSSVSGKVSVVDFIYGDANGDQKIDIKDVILLRQYIAAFDFDANTSSVNVEAEADINGDGQINMKDIVMIRQYIANHNG